ncbi:MAG: hypothetical protein ABIP34_03120 [Rhodoferax sp.]|uniref:hypothetical protein n=1 Tax=Rhodoferax sp. TaxID=50421 RepID=UPI003262F89F
MPVVAFRSDVLLYLRCLVALAALCCDALVRAQAQEGGEPTPQWELATQSAPSLQRADGRMDSRTTLTGWSGPASKAGVGMGLGWTVPSQTTVGDGRSTAPGLDMGLHWRSVDQGQGQIRIGVWQHVSPWPSPVGIARQTTNPIHYNTRLEMQFSAASARGIQFELGGALGMQLNNNERVVLRLSRGKPMVYYRVKF